MSHDSMDFLQLGQRDSHSLVRQDRLALNPCTEGAANIRDPNTPDSGAEPHTSWQFT